MTHASTVSIPPDERGIGLGHAPVPAARGILAPEGLPPLRSVSPASPGSADDPMLLSRVSRKACAADFFLFGIYTLGYTLVINDLYPGSTVRNSGTDPRMRIVLVTLACGVLSVVLVGLLTKMRSLGAASLGLTRRALPTHLLLGLSTTVATFAVFYLGVLAVALFWPDGYAQLRSNPGRIADTLPRLPTIGFAGLSLAVGCYEEIVFRGFVFTRLRRLTGHWAAAALLGSAIFTIPHLTMQAAPTAIPLFGIALVWCGVTWWRRSLVPAIIGHFLFNFIQLVGMAAQDPSWK